MTIRTKIWKNIGKQCINLGLINFVANWNEVPNLRLIHLHFSWSPRDCDVSPFLRNNTPGHMYGGGFLYVSSSSPSVAFVKATHNQHSEYPCVSIVFQSVADGSRNETTFAWKEKIFCNKFHTKAVPSSVLAALFTAKPNDPHADRFPKQ